MNKFILFASLLCSTVAVAGIGGGGGGTRPEKFNLDVGNLKVDLGNVLGGGSGGTRPEFVGIDLKSLKTQLGGTLNSGGSGGGTRPDVSNVDFVKVIGTTEQNGIVFGYKPVESNVVTVETIKVLDANVAYLEAFKKSRESNSWVAVKIQREPPRVPSWCELNPLSPACNPGSGPNAADECNRNPIAPGCQPGQ